MDRIMIFVSDLIEKISDDIEIIIEYDQNQLYLITFLMIEAHKKKYINLSDQLDIISLIVLIEGIYINVVGNNFVDNTDANILSAIKLSPLIKKIVNLMISQNFMIKMKKTYDDNYYPFLINQLGGHLYDEENKIIYLTK